MIDKTNKLKKEQIESFFDDGFARKIVRLDDCDLTRFPDNVTIPLDIPAAGHPNRDPWYEVRLFVVVDGVLAPMGDTGHCDDGDENHRYQHWNSGLLPLDDQGQTWINVSTEFHIDTYEGGDEDGDPGYLDSWGNRSSVQGQSEGVES